MIWLALITLPQAVIIIGTLIALALLGGDEKTETSHQSSPILERLFTTYPKETPHVISKT